jgi:hypothetical protein
MIISSAPTEKTRSAGEVSWHYVGFRVLMI